MTKFKRWFAFSDHPVAVAARKIRRWLLDLSLPTPVLIVRPALAVFLVVRRCYYFLFRFFVCEPLFKAYCTQYGRGVRTGVYIHWFTGSGKLLLGDHVLVDGKCSFSFAARYTDDPVLEIGSNTIISHGCCFTVGRRITIGRDCMISTGVVMFDSPGHPTDPVLRKAGAPANPDDVRAIQVHDNVWIGRSATVFPGVTVGEGSVVGVGALVVSDVPPYTIVAGNPARVIGRLRGGTPAATGANAQAPAGPCLEAVMTIVRQILGTDELAPDEDFYDAGLTSIMALPLLVELERRFGLTISQHDFSDARTGHDLAATIERLGVPSTNGEPLGSLPGGVGVSDRNVPAVPTGGRAAALPGPARRPPD